VWNVSSSQTHPAISRIRACGTIACAGKHDPATPPEANEYISKHIAGAKFTLLDAAHLSNIEQPEAYTKAVLDFLMG
jgi:3-oxoadipate enol-lactonase